MKTLWRLPPLFVLLVFIAGCANYHTEKYFERNPTAVAASKTISGSDTRATVYLFRPKVLLQAISIQPIIPLYYALDGKMLSIMPLGSHVVLSLEPGHHNFTRLIVVRGITFQNEVRRADAEIDLSAGKTYYIGSIGFGARTFGLVDSQAGSDVIADSKLAKFIHQPVNVDTFLSKVASGGKKDSNPAPSQPPTESAQNGIASSIRDALPSAKQVGSFLEGLAAVALIGLVVFAAAHGGASGDGAQYAPPSPSIAAPTYVSPAYAQNIIVQPQATTRTWQNSSGTLSEILQSKTEVTINNITTGVRSVVSQRFHERRL